MKVKLTALIVALFLIVFTYVATAYPKETMTLLWHAVALVVIDVLISVVRLGWPKD